MITLPQPHYHNLLQLITSLHTNITLLLPSNHRHDLQPLFEQFQSLNSTLQSTLKSFLSQSQKHKITLIQYESQIKTLRQKTQAQFDVIKTHETEITRVRHELARNQKENQKLKEVVKQMKSEIGQKDKSLQEMQDHYKTQLKMVKKQYKEENKELKERVKQLEELLKTAIVTNSNHQVEMELDKELEELKRFQIEQENNL